VQRSAAAHYSQRLRIVRPHLLSAPKPVQSLRRLRVYFSERNPASFLFGVNGDNPRSEVLLTSYFCFAFRNASAGPFPEIHILFCTVSDASFASDRLHVFWTGLSGDRMNESSVQGFLKRRSGSSRCFRGTLLDLQPLQDRRAR
jgi:hypothetical protein